MEQYNAKFKIRLGLFVALGSLLFVTAIFIIGRQKNMFNPVFKLTSTFYNVSGLQVGNNVRFRGINIGTVDNIDIINDSTVKIEMLIKKEIQKFIKPDCIVSIGSEGLIGDRLLLISQGNAHAKKVKPGQELASNEPVEMDDIVASLQISARNAEIITLQMAEITFKINHGGGILGKLIQDSAMARDFNLTMNNLRSSSKGLDENMQAVKDNFLLRGYFKRHKQNAIKK